MDYRERKELRDYIEEARLNRRLLIVRILFILLFASCLGGLYYLQIVEFESYSLQADMNRLRKAVIHPLRGNMFDRDQRALVANRTSFNLVLDREKLREPERVIARLAPIIGVDEATLRARLDRYRSRPAFEPAILEEDVGLREIARLEARRWENPEMQIQTESRRYYPERRALAHVVGTVGEATEAQLAADSSMQMGDVVGRSGLEKAYDDRLRGRNGEQLVEVNSIGRALGPVFVGTRPTAGHDLYLTLDMDLQRELVRAFGEEAGAGVFLDPRNGEILAMASMPAFDPNLFASRFSPEEWKAIGSDPLHPLQNRVIASTYSPGSTFKLLIAMAALEEGVADEGTVVHCNGGATFYGRRFGCWKEGGHGAVDLHRAIVQSCNVFFYTVGQRLGIDKIARYAKAVGFGVPTGLDLPGEKGGIVPSPEWKMATRKEPWYAGETISVSIGQGPILVTAVQMANMAACVANGGPIYRPRLVREGPGWSVTPEPAHDVKLSAHTLAVLRQAMWGVVHESGTGGRARLPDVEVLGKTGTVQVFKASAGVDSDKLSKAMRDHAWFVGYAPRENPTIAFAVFVEHGGHGGEVSAPIVHDVLKLFFSKDRRPGLGPGPLPTAPAPPPAPQLASVAAPNR